jgi:hypothetical protein
VIRFSKRVRMRTFRQRVSVRFYTLPADAVCSNGLWHSESENRRMLEEIRKMEPRAGRWF